MSFKGLVEALGSLAEQHPGVLAVSGLHVPERSISLEAEIKEAKEANEAQLRRTSWSSGHASEATELSQT